MKRKLSFLFVLIWLCGFVVSAPMISVVEPVIVYANQIKTLRSDKEFLAAFRKEAEQFKKTFTFDIGSSVNLDNSIDILLNDASLGIFNLDIIQEYYKDSRGREIPADSYIHIFTVTYYDDLRILKAYNEPSFINSLTKKEKETLSKAIEIIENVVMEDMTEYDKILAIHDYLILNGEYDMRINTDKAPPESFNAEGIILNGTGVCMSYAASFRLLINMIDIECLIVYGKTGEENHAWNKVKIDDTWTNIDVTRNDPFPDIKGRVGYGYFGLTDKELARTHEWDNTGLPKATSKSVNYYHRNKLIAANYTQFKNIITSAVKLNPSLKEYKIHLYVTNYDADAYSFDFLLDILGGYSVNYTKLDTPYGEMDIVIKKQ